MKKIVVRILSAMIAAASFTAPLSGTAVFGMTIEKDAQTAVEKNKELFLASWEKADITADFTVDDLYSLIYGASEHSADEYVGMAFAVENFRVKKPTSSKTGLVSADVIFYQGDAEDGFSISKELPKLIGSDSAVDDDEDEDTDNSENTSSETVIDSSAAKKELQAAASAINAAMFDFDVSNDTTRSEILNMAKAALPEGSHVKVTLSSSDINIVKATTSVNGTLSATLELLCGTETKRTTVAKTIQPIVTADSIKLGEDRSAINHAISIMNFTNNTTKEDILAVAVKAAKNGTKVEWKDNFVKKDATFHEDGNIFGYLILTLGSETFEQRVSETIPTLLSKMPSDKISLVKKEWDILYRVNTERAKYGVPLLTIAGPLQDACNIREGEAADLFSHTRPDGTSFRTAISSSFKCAGTGENLHKCTPGHETVENAMTGWMNSTGHRANILNENYDYIGVGFNGTVAVQIFAIAKNPYSSVTTSAGTMHFADEESMMREYLICTSPDGLVTYMPLDTQYMKKTDSGYTLNIRSAQPVVFTIGDSTNINTAENTSAANDNSADTAAAVSFDDVKSNAYYANAVKWAVDRKITAGTSKTTFSPDDTCTRAQILTFLWRAVGSPQAASENPFSDVNTGDYYYNAAVWASEQGMVSGNTFSANTPCTRASTVMYMWKYAGSPETAPSSQFTDVSSSNDYAQAVAWALSNGVTSGTSDTTFSPDAICSRGQIVTFLNRAIK